VEVVIATLLTRRSPIAHMFDHFIHEMG
jgi:hypothetical protein